MGGLDGSELGRAAERAFHDDARRGRENKRELASPAWRPCTGNVAFPSVVAGHNLCGSNCSIATGPNSPHFMSCRNAAVAPPFGDTVARDQDQSAAFGVDQFGRLAEAPALRRAWCRKLIELHGAGIGLHLPDMKPAKCPEAFEEPAKRVGVQCPSPHGDTLIDDKRQTQPAFARRTQDRRQRPPFGDAVHRRGNVDDTIRSRRHAPLQSAETGRAPVRRATAPPPPPALACPPGLPPQPHRRGRVKANIVQCPPVVEASMGSAPAPTLTGLG